MHNLLTPHTVVVPVIGVEAPELGVDNHALKK
jgi:hypothetical protein